MVFGGSVQSALLASVLSMVTCVAVVEPRPGAQAATMALGFASALGTVCVATLVTGSTLASGAVLCALVFVIVLARAVGPRGMAIGMLGFMGYFFANFIRARPSQIPQIALAIAVGGAVAFVVRFLVIPEHPARTQRRVLRAFAARMRLSLDDLEAEIAAPHDGARRRRRIRRDTGRLNEIALALEDSVGQPATTAATPADAPARLSQVRGWLHALMRAELAVDLLADAVHRIAQKEWSQPARLELAAATAGLRQWIGSSRAATVRADVDRHLDQARRLAAADSGGEVDSLALARRADVWSRVERSVELLFAARPWQAVPETGIARETLSPLAFRPGGGGTAGLTGVRPNLRLAIQATVAVALATAAGRALSATRWYWAAITAFTVYARAATAAETLSRAWQRMLGTAGGVVAAIAVAAILRRHVAPSILIAVVAAAAAYGLLRISYAGMVLFLTIALGLLYELLGRPVPGLMMLRLGESAIGAVVGVGVASIVVPMRSTERVRRLVAELLRRSAQVLEAASKPGLDPARDADLFAAIRSVDRVLAEVRNALRPLWSPGLPIELSRLVTPGRLSAALAYTIRRLVVDLPPGALEAEPLKRAGAQIADQCRAAADALDRNQRPVLASAKRAIDGSSGPDAISSPHPEPAGAVELFETLSDLLRRLSASVAPRAFDK